MQKYFTKQMRGAMIHVKGGQVNEKHYKSFKRSKQVPDYAMYFIVSATYDRRDCKKNNGEQTNGS